MTKKHPIALLIFFLFLAGCRQKAPADTPAETVSQRTQAVAGSPFIRPMQETLTMNAVTTYINRENIRATTTGYVQQTSIEQGSRVEKGQKLFSLKTKEAEALGDEILNDPSINITGVIPIVSRNSGVITQVFFQDGDYVVDGDVLAELAKPNSLAIKLYVPYEYNSLVKLQQPVKVQLPGGETLNGVVRRLLPSAEASSQTTPYLVAISPFRFLPENLNVAVVLSTRASNSALAVPLQAVQSNEEQTRFWVMKIVNDSLAIQHPVELGIRADSVIELKNSQLTPADRIVVQGAYGLPDTAAITLVEKL